jgi:hypothetical protein
VTGPPSPTADTLLVRSIGQPPPAAGGIGSTWGRPQVSIPTEQGDAAVWLLRAADTLFVVARIPDRSRSWTDAVTVCLDAGGDGGGSPGHDDFQWFLRRTLDSSVVSRGRGGRWTPPLDDPDWRLGVARGGGGWEVGEDDDPEGWQVVLRLDPAWLEGHAGRRPAIAFLIHDNDPNRWYPWPLQATSAGVSLVERTPALWVPVR